MKGYQIRCDQQFHVGHCTVLVPSRIQETECTLVQAYRCSQEGSAKIYESHEDALCVLRSERDRLLGELCQGVTLLSQDPYPPKRVAGKRSKTRKKKVARKAPAKRSKRTPNKKASET